MAVMKSHSREQSVGFYIVRSQSHLGALILWATSSVLARLFHASFSTKHQSVTLSQA